MNEVKVDPKISNAILKVRKSVTALTHDETNPHGGYSYASIDNYYKQVVPLANEAGVTWRVRQTAFKLEQIQGRDRPRPFVQVDFAFDVFVDDAESLNHMCFTVMLPLEGAQTAGQMFSYADKVFMRVTFSIPTGERDGDAATPESSRPASRAQTPPTQRPVDHDPITGEVLGQLESIEKKLLTDEITGTNGTAPPSALMDKIAAVSGTTSLEGDPILEPRKIDDKGVDIVVAVFREWMPTIQTTNRLRDFHAQNLAAIDKVGQYSPEKRAEIKALFNARNAELKELK